MAAARGMKVVSPAAMRQSNRWKEMEIMAADKKQLPSGISLRKDGRYQARYTFNGKHHTIYGKDLKEVQRKLRDAKYEMDHGIYAKPDRITVDSWYKTWLKEYRDNVVRETTIIGNEKCYKHIKPEIGHMKLQAIRPEHIQKVLNKMKREGYSGGYIENTRQTMNMIFHQAHMNGIIITNPVERSILPKVEYKRELQRESHSMQIFFMWVFLLECV